MFYGTFYWLSNLSREIYDRWVPLTARLAEAGWEPITHAHTAGPVMIERFGRIEDGSLHFTLRNDTDQPHAVEVHLDAVGLGLTRPRNAEVWLVRDSYTFERLETHRSAREWAISLTVPAADTLVLRVADEAGIALDHLWLVPDLLRRAANYRRALEAAGASVAAPDYDEVLSHLAEVAQSVRRKAAEARADLEAMARNLPAPQVAGAEEKGEGWAQRLKDLTAQARARILAAAEAL
jgi:hypothetical protein